MLNDIEQPIPKFQGHTIICCWISQKRYEINSFNGILIWTYTCSAQGCHFEWPSMTLSDLVKYWMTCSVARSLWQLSLLLLEVWDNWISVLWSCTLMGRKDICPLKHSASAVTKFPSRGLTHRHQSSSSFLVCRQQCLVPLLASSLQSDVLSCVDCFSQCKLVGLDVI